MTLLKKLRITRDSVHAGDDCDAPHQRWLTRSESESLDSVMQSILSDAYLPQIFGGQASWIVCGPGALAVVAQQWKAPHFLVDAQTAIADFDELTFVYWCQVDPDKLIKCLQTGLPLPDKYGQ